MSLNSKSLSQLKKDEIEAYKIFKIVIEEKMGFKIPLSVVKDDIVYPKAPKSLRNNLKEGKLLSEAELYKFDKVYLDNIFDKDIPNIILEKNDSKLILQLAINQYAKKEIIQMAEMQKTSTLEIDLRDINEFKYSKSLLRKVILEDVERKAWLYNINHPKAREKLIKSNKEVLEKVRKVLEKIQNYI